VPVFPELFSIPVTVISPSISASLTLTPFPEFTVTEPSSTFTVV